MSRHIASPRGWDRSDVESDRDWAVQLTSAQLADFERAVGHASRTGKTLLQMSRSDFPLGGDAAALLRAAVGETQIGRGFQLVRGFPVQRMTVDEARLLFWGIGLHLGVARPQGKSSTFMADVRDIGTDYRSTTGRGYTSRSALDFHADGSDLVGLMCIRTGKSGGESLISSSIRAHNEMLARDPDAVRELSGLFTFSRQGEEAPEEPPYYQASVFGWHDGRFACRHLRNHIQTAQKVFAEVPRLTDAQVSALDLLDETLARDDLCFRMSFQPGDVQLINNHIVLHARTDFEDCADLEHRRHLLRLWTAIPQGQALPENWSAAYKDVGTPAVRGGYRGIGITPEVRAFEERLAAEHRMRLAIYADLDRHLGAAASDSGATSAGMRRPSRARSRVEVGGARSGRANRTRTSGG